MYFSRSILLFVLTFFAQLINGSTSSARVIAKAVEGAPDYEVITLGKNGSDEPTLFDLQRSVVFSPSGLTCFFKHIVSSRRYTEDVLPYKFKHVYEFLNHGTNTNQGRVYTKAVLRLFDKKIKEAPFVSVTEVMSFVQQLPDVIAKDLASDDGKKKKVHKIVRTELETKFDDLKTDPDGFLDALAQKIVSEKYHAHEISRKELCVYATKFVDDCVGKAMWSAQTDVWDLFIQLGHALVALQKKGIIHDRDALDDCVWTLVTRFAHFVSLWGSDLPIGFYQKAGEQLGKGLDFLDALEEQEVGLKTKTGYLKEVLVEGAIKANARQNGIITEPVIKSR